jgi:protease II
LIDPQENGVMTFPNMGVSRDGELVVYKEVVNVEGFPRVSGNLRILNVSSGGIFPDIIEDVRNPQIAWDAKGRGFFYFTNVRNTGFQ